MGDWAKDKRPVWEAICDKYGGNKEAFDWGTWGFFDWATGKSWPTISTMVSDFLRYFSRSINDPWPKSLLEIFSRSFQLFSRSILI